MSLGEKPPHLRNIPVTELLDAKIHTADFLAQLGLEENVDAAIEAEAAQAAFRGLTQAHDEDEQRQAVALLESPESVRKLVGMLTAFEWEYVHEANRIRSYLTAKLLEDCEDLDPRVRLKAIELAGKIKEVALFEERVVRRNENVSDDEINARLKALMERAAARAKPSQAVEDVAFLEKK